MTTADNSRKRWVIPVTAAAVTALLLSAVWTEARLSRRCLMIHADDAGMCPSMNQATIDSLEHGVATSASIMAPCPGFAEFAAWAVDHPEYDYGVHLTLTNETRRFTWGPLTAADQVPSLLAPDGFFWQTSEDVAQHVRREEAEKELRAQIEAVRNAGIRISHLDSHMYSLLSRPDLIDLYVQLGLDYDVPVRFRDVEAMPPEQKALFADGLLEAYAAAERKLRDHGMPILTWAESANYDASPDEKRNHFIGAVRKLPAGTSEFVVHCGYQTDDGMQPPYVSGRVEDAIVFQSRDMKNELRRLGVQLVDWQDLRQQVSSPTGSP